RWTEQRNFEAVLDMLADGRLDVKPLISHRFGITEAQRAYEVVAGSEPSLGVLLTYQDDAGLAEAPILSRTVRLAPPAPITAAGKGRPVSIGVIGSGNYATGVLIPAFKAAGARLRTVASNGGVSSVHAGRKFGFETATTDVESMLADETLDAVVITTRHDTHAALVVKALEAGKHVFVEKTLALRVEDIDAIEAAYGAAVERG